MKPTFNEKQIEAYNLLKSIGGEKDIPPAVIDEIMLMLDGKNKKEIIKKEEDSELIIKARLLNEKDWRKRAALSAMLISKSLE